MRSKAKYLVPNSITFISLICGILSILFAIKGDVYFGGLFILASYLLDTLDGATARRLNASSEFGLQLDSLVDMVSLGTAPAAVVFLYLNQLGIDHPWAWGWVVLLPLAGAFRLARFNLLPMKESSNTDSAGMTISMGGANVALFVLVDFVTDGNFIDSEYILPFLAFHSIFMVSLIPFPSIVWVFAKERLWWLLPLIALTIWQMTLLPAWFFLQIFYLVVVLIRYIISKLKG